MIQHIDLPPDAVDRLTQQIEQDYQSARAQHDERVKRFADYEALYRGLSQKDANGETVDYNYLLLLQHTATALADYHEKILGLDGEISVSPIEQTDARRVDRIKAFINWMFFEQMRPELPILQLLFYAELFGRAHYAIAWEPQMYWVREPETGMLVEQQWSDSPRLTPVHYRDLVIPAVPNAQSIQDFSFVIHRVYQSPVQLADMERRGQVYGVIEKFDELVSVAGREFSAQWQVGESLALEELATGQNYANAYSAGTDVGAPVEVWQWYGYFRNDHTAGMVPEHPEEDSFEEMAGQQHRAQSGDEQALELRVTYIPALRRVIGIHSLFDLEPNTPYRRPFGDIATAFDTYWGVGLGERLAATQRKLTALHVRATVAAEMQALPPLFHGPGANIPRNAQIASLKPFEVGDPSKIQWGMGSNLNGLQYIESALVANAERTEGRSDMAMGRAQSQTRNAPKTLGGQAILDRNADKRGNLPVAVLRQHLNHMIERIWMLACQWAPEEVFVRVTGKAPNGMMDAMGDILVMSREEFTGRFDFSINFATSYTDREFQRARANEIIPAVLQNPLVMQDPASTWRLLNWLWERNGFKNFGDLVPNPGPADLPVSPEQEATMLIQGEPIYIHPMDNDQAHIQRHQIDLAKVPPQLRQALIEHTMDHQNAMQVKMAAAAQAMRSGVADAVMAGQPERKDG